jgi:hypothetical protein
MIPVVANAAVSKGKPRQLGRSGCSGVITDRLGDENLRTLDATDVTSLLLLEEAVAYHTLSAHTMVPTPSPNGNPPRGLPARHATVLAGDSVVSAGFGFYAVAFVFDLNGMAFVVRRPSAGDDVIEVQSIHVDDDLVNHAHKMIAVSLLSCPPAAAFLCRWRLT